MNYFRNDPNFERNEARWEELAAQVVGEEEPEIVQQPVIEEKEEKTEIVDMTEQDLINLRKTIYLTIMNSVDFEECCHKLLKLSIRECQQVEMCGMIVDCCMQERTFTRYYGLLAQRLCNIGEDYQ